MCSRSASVGISERLFRRRGRLRRPIANCARRRRPGGRNNLAAVRRPRKRHLPDRCPTRRGRRRSRMSRRVPAGQRLTSTDPCGPRSARGIRAGSPGADPAAGGEGEAARVDGQFLHRAAGEDTGNRRVLWWWADLGLGFLWTMQEATIGALPVDLADGFGNLGATPGDGTGTAVGSGSRSVRTLWSRPAFAHVTRAARGLTRR
jgi:hypothetical protein